MKNIICLFVMVLISNAANAADKWEYCNFEYSVIMQDTLKSEDMASVVRIHLESRVIKWAVKDLVTSESKRAVTINDKKKWENQIKIAANALNQQKIDYPIFSKSNLLWPSFSPIDLSSSLGRSGWEMVSTNIEHVKTEKSIRIRRLTYHFKRKITK